MREYNEYDNKDMLEVATIINKINSISSRNEKIEILEQNKDNTILQDIFVYAYSPYKVYGIGKKSLEGVDELGVNMAKPNFPSIFALLDYLDSVNVNNEVRGEVISFLESTPISLRDLYVRLLLKDLRIGVTDTIANRVWKNLVPRFELMQGKNFYDRVDKIGDVTFALSTKFDGQRLVIIKRDGKVELRARSGKLIEGCIEIEEDAKKLPDNMVYDGEVLKANPDNLPSKELFIETRKIMGSKGDKVGLEFHMFDALPLSEFEAGESSEVFLDRKRFITNLINGGGFKTLQNAPILYVGKDLDVVDKYLEEAISSDEEGLMCNLNKTYECKRSNNLLKVKKFFTMDLEVLDIIEGQGRLENTLGSIEVEYKDGVVNVGSGFSDKQRKEIYDNAEKYIGRVAEVQYFEKSQAADGGQSLRFPTFVKFREKGKKVSYD